MNQDDRRELERLKERQRLLQGRLAELQRFASDLQDLQSQLGAFESRLARSEPELAPEPTAAPVAEGAPLAAPPPIPPEAYVPFVARETTPQAEPAQPARQPEPPPLAAMQTGPAPSVQPAATETTPPPATAAETPAPIVPPLIPVEPRKKTSFELRLGTYWLVRIGIVMLLTGLVFLANLAYKKWVVQMGPWGKLALLYLGGFGLLGVGAWLNRKQETLKNYAQVLVAGGLAAVYFTTYAAHHFEFLRVITSPVLDAVLLLAWAGVIVALADWKKSEVMALFAIVLSYYNAVITRVGMFTLYSNLVLALAATVFLVRNRWAALSCISLAATYAGYAFWRFLGAEGWHWASPEEGLWHGASFLMCYWLVFTAAVFLCKRFSLPGLLSSAAPEADSETVDDRSRAGFLTFNNGAFFGLFLLTMLQVRHGGFWKVCLSFGTVLLILAFVARFLLAGQRLSRYAYLAQGLLLVTLGFITWLTGTKLAVVLATETVLLLVVGRILDNKLLRGASWLTAALAVLALGATLQSFDRSGLLAGFFTGLLLLFAAWWCEWSAPEKKTGPANDVSYFAALALFAWLLATWKNTRPEWRGLAFGLETAVFLGAYRFLGVLRSGAFVYAGLAVGCGLWFLVDQVGRSTLGERSGFYQHIALGVVLLACALHQREEPDPETEWWTRVESYFSALALASWLAVTWAFARPFHLAPLLAVETLLFTFSWRWVRLPALAVLGQVFLLIAQFTCVSNLMEVGLGVPWWNSVVVVAATLAVSHWWQRPERAHSPAVAQLGSVLYALAAVGVLLLWLRLCFAPPVWLALSSVLALGVTAYALATRLWFLAAFGQLFFLASIFQFLRQTDGSHLTPGPAWYLSLVPIAALCGLSAGVTAWLGARGAIAEGTKQTLARVGTGYRAVAALLALGWVFEYVSLDNRFWCLALAGGALFGLFLRRPAVETLAYSLFFTLAGFLQVWVRYDTSARIVYWPNLLGILLLLVQQQLARRRLPAIPDPYHAFFILLGGCTLWMYVSHLVKYHSGGFGFFLTATWAGLALVVFSAGFLLRERFYRWLGLAILAAALGRVILFDVWKLDTVYRILSFMALGVVLLVLGFIYNKYQEKIRQWL